jgi:hypothetical protein
VTAKENDMRKLIILSFGLLASLSAFGATSTHFALGIPTANCIPVLSQDGMTLTQGQGAVCPQGFFGGGGWQISLPDGPITLYTCQATAGPLVKNGASATLTTTLSCADAPGWSGSITQDFTLERVYCGRGRYCESYVDVGGVGELTQLR